MSESTLGAISLETLDDIIINANCSGSSCLRWGLDVHAISMRMLRANNSAAYNYLQRNLVDVDAKQLLWVWNKRYVMDRYDVLAGAAVI